MKVAGEATTRQPLEMKWFSQVTATDHCSRSIPPDFTCCWLHESLSTSHSGYSVSPAPGWPHPYKKICGVSQTDTRGHEESWAYLAAGLVSGPLCSRDRMTSSRLFKCMFLTKQSESDSTRVTSGICAHSQAPCSSTGILLGKPELAGSPLASHSLHR